MTQGETTKLLAIVKQAYPNFCKSNTDADNKATLVLWSRCLEEYDYKDAENALYALIKKLKFVPTIAELREECENVRGAFCMLRPVPIFKIEGENYEQIPQSTGNV